MRVAIGIVFVLALIFSGTIAQAADADIVVQKVPSRPGAEAGPTKVSVGIYVVDIDSINSVEQHFTGNVFVVLKWNDPRLAHHSKDPKRYAAIDIWTPNIQIANETGIVRRTLPEVVDVNGSGDVRYVQRFVGPFSQPLNLRDFPFDKQPFTIELVAVGNNPGDIVFVPDESFVTRGLPGAVGMSKNISLPDWKIDSFEAKTKVFEVSPDISNAGYAFEFQATRSTGHYIWKVILPLIFIVVMSWSVFWIDPEQIGTKMTVAITSMLTLIAYRFAIDAQVPRVPYMTRLDQFIVASTVIIFLSMLDVIIGAALFHKKRKAIAVKINAYSGIIFPLIFCIAVAMTLIF